MDRVKCPDCYYVLDYDEEVHFLISPFMVCPKCASRDLRMQDMDMQDME